MAQLPSPPVVSAETRRLWACVNRHDAGGAAAALAAGADPNALVGAGNDKADVLGALHNAMQLCDPALVRAMIEGAARAGAALEWTRPSGLRGHTPLMMPVTARPTARPADLVAVLAAALGAGAASSIDARGNTGAIMEDDADLSYTAMLYFLVMGAEHEAGARALLDAGARVNQRIERTNNAYKPERRGTSPLHGMDALMAAVYGGFSASFVTALLDRCACLGHVNVRQQTALMIGIQHARKIGDVSAAAAMAIIEWVRARGAELDGLPAPAGMPRTRAADALEVPDPNGYRALHYAASFGAATAPLVAALVAAGADREAHCVCGWTPLMVAAGARSVRGVEAMLAAGAFANNHDAFGVAALHVAIAHSSNGADLGCLDALLAWPATDALATTITGLTPLALAHSSGNVLAAGRLQLRILADAALVAAAAVPGGGAATAAGGAAAVGKVAAAAAAREEGRLAALSAAQLRTELASRNITTAGCTERCDYVEALRAPPSAASGARAEEQRLDLVEKVSYIGLPSSPHMLLWGRLPLRAYRESSAVLRALPDNDLMGDGTMWCRDGQGWCGDEAPQGVSDAVTASRRRGPYFLQQKLFQEIKSAGPSGPRRGLGEALKTQKRADGTTAVLHKMSFDISGAGCEERVGFPLRWRTDFERSVNRRPQLDLVRAQSWIEVLGAWGDGYWKLIPEQNCTFPERAELPRAEGEPIKVMAIRLETFAPTGDRLGAKAPFRERAAPGFLPPEIEADATARFKLVHRGTALVGAMKATATAAGASSLGAGAAQAAQVCATCRRSAAEEGVALAACARCKAVLYCGTDCQRAAWPAHKPTCKAVGAAQRKSEAPA